MSVDLEKGCAECPYKEVKQTRQQRRQQGLMPLGDLCTHSCQIGLDKACEAANKRDAQKQRKSFVVSVGISVVVTVVLGLIGFSMGVM